MEISISHCSLEESSTDFESPQAYYVNENSPSFILPDDQLIVTNTPGENKQNFILEPDPLNILRDNDETVIINNNIKPLGEDDIAADTEAPQEQVNATTEITLNEDQWKIMEQNGWLVLEANGKIYLLDTLGLHDISDNKELIENLRNEATFSTPNEINTESFICELNGLGVCSEDDNGIGYYRSDGRLTSAPQRYEIPEGHEIIQSSNETANVTQNIQIAAKGVLSAEKEQNISTPKQNSPPVKAPIAASTVLTTQGVIKTQAEFQDANQDCNMEDYQIPIHRSVLTNREKTMRFKTNLRADAIPKRLVLGKTVNGKKLVAKIKNIQPPVMLEPSLNGQENASKKIHDTIQTPVNKGDNGVTDTPPLNTIESDKMKIGELFKNFLQNNFSSPRIADVNSAEVLVNQLLSISSTRDRLVRQNLLITKTCNDECDGLNIAGDPTYVTGSVLNVPGDEDKWVFLNEPKLLQKIVNENFSLNVAQDAATKHVIVHLHIVEVKQQGGLTKTSITISKQQIRLQPKPRKLVHACASCAKLFETEQDLREHTRKPCTVQSFEEDSPLTIDVRNVKDHFRINRQDSAKSFRCIYCNAAVDQRGMKRHLQTHMGPKNGTDVDKEFHKCHMCPSSYYHKSSLSKHIVRSHIKNIK